jgi:hypothetical protein
VSDADLTAARSYRPGSWFGIFGEAVVVCLPPSEKARVGELWELVDGGATFDEVLDALISGGLRDLPGFVLVSQGEETKVVIRGQAYAAFVSAGEKVQVEGTASATWVERSFPDVTAMELYVGEETDGSLLPINSGLVRIAAVAAPGGSWSSGGGSRAAVAEAEPAPVPPVQPDPAPAEDEPAAAPAVPLDAPLPPAEVPEDQTADQPAVEHDGLTLFGRPEPDPEPPGIPGQPPAPAVTSRPVAKLVFSNGETVEVDRAILVGRSPEARRFASGDQPRLVSVPSPNQEISSTHLEIRPGSGADHGTAVVTDLGSTNGSVLVQPGLPPEDLTPGMAIQLIPGAIIDLGDGVTIQVINP